MIENNPKILQEWLVGSVFEWLQERRFDGALITTRHGRGSKPNCVIL